MNKLFFVIIVCIISGTARGQYNYFPFYTTDTLYRSTLSTELSQRIGNSFILPKSAGSKYKKDFKTEQSETVDYTKRMIRYSLLKDSLIYPYLVSVLDNIIKSNPSLKNYTLLLSDWPNINAAYIGGQVIVIYAPLLSRIQNESQLAFVICHELAHGELNHLQRSLQNRLDAYYDKDFQKELKKTIHSSYNVQKKLDGLALKYTFGTLYHSRSLEKAADSLGYIFLSKTDYDVKESIATLEVLKHIDEPVFADSIDYASIFRCDNSSIKFPDLKGYRSNSIFNPASEINSMSEGMIDSLRTHPDCDKRIGYVKQLMKSIPSKQFNASINPNFGKIQWASVMEMIMGLFKYENYDNALFNALQYNQHYPGNEFLKIMILLNYFNLHKAMKNHELADYVTNFSDGNSKAQNDFLAALNNLRLSEMTEFMRCFHEKQESSLKKDEYVLAINYCMSAIGEDGKQKNWQDQYRLKYKNGQFSSLLELDKGDKKKGKK